MASIFWSDQPLMTDINAYESPIKLINNTQNHMKLPVMEKWEQTLTFLASLTTWYQVSRPLESF